MAAITLMLRHISLSHYISRLSSGECLLVQIGNSSVISVLARTSLHNSSLHCTAFNPLLPDTRVQASTHLLVHCEYLLSVLLSANTWCADKPRVQLSLGKSIEMDKVKEGEDIYLECAVDSRPQPYKLFFKHQVYREYLKHWFC